MIIGYAATAISCFIFGYAVGEYRTLSFTMKCLDRVRPDIMADFRASQTQKEAP